MVRTPRQPNMKLAAMIRDARTQAGKTQLEFAVAAGVTPATVSRAETGAHTPDLATLQRFADALEMPLADLIAA